MNFLRGENLYLIEFKTTKEKWSRDHSGSKAEGYVGRLLKGSRFIIYLRKNHVGQLSV